MSAGRAAGLASRVTGLEMSPTVAMAQHAQALRAQGLRVYDFTVGEPDQPTPVAIVAAAREALEAGWTKYAPAAGIPEMRAAVAERYRRDWGAPFIPEQVTVTVGAKQALAQLYTALLDRGGEVVVPTPHWPTFAEAARIAGGRPVLLPLDRARGYRLTARAVARRLGPRTRAILVNSPCNPTGAVVEPEELVALARLARRRGVFLILDDTYAHLIFRREKVPALDAVAAAAGDRLAVAGTMSKSYCMTGWRVGWVIASPAVAAACAALNSHSVQGPATFAQVAATRALRGSQKPVRELATEYRRRMAAVQPLLDALPGVVCPESEGGFYLFPHVAGHRSRERPDTVALAARLLEEQGVAVVPGEGFGAPGHLRVSLAASLEDLREGTRRMVEFLSRGQPRW